MTWLRFDATLDGMTWRSDMCVKVRDDIIERVLPLSELADGIQTRHIPAAITPGLFDIQVNGGGGVMFNNDPTPDGVRRIADAHRCAGTRFILPTVITDQSDVMERAADAVLATVGTQGILGIHIEGPHINPTQKGTHNPDFIRSLDQHTWGQVEKLRIRKVPVLLTLAPECVPAGTIRRLDRMGVVVAAGHTAATASEFAAAVQEGLRGITHLFNGMPAMTSRAPMITGAAINSEVWCTIIADGHHVDPSMVRLAIRSRPREGRTVLMSDAMSTVGGPETFELYGETIQVQNGCLINKLGSLAGAHVTLAEAVRNSMHFADLTTTEALHMAAVAPFELMRIPPMKYEGARIQDVIWRQ